MPRIEALGLEGAALEPQQPGQCLLAFAGKPHSTDHALWALSATSDRANTLWLDRLYLRHASAPASCSALGLRG